MTITERQKKQLAKIAKKIVVQGYSHEDNIIAYFKVMVDAAREEFREDNKITLDSFLTECHESALE